jgi:hypothetical protein
MIRAPRMVSFIAPMILACIATSSRETLRTRRISAAIPPSTTGNPTRAISDMVTSCHSITATSATTLSRSVPRRVATRSSA